jgi:hypothetical protein
MSNSKQFNHNLQKAKRQQQADREIIENKNLSIDNIEARENYITMSRPSFEATIMGRKYEISATAYGDTIEDIQIISSDTFEQIYFEDEELNKEIEEELCFILNNQDRYNILGVV